MLAAVLGAPGEINLARISTPRPGPDEVVVAVQRASLCGTDLKIRSHTFFGARGVPSSSFVPGHEFAGVVAAVGDEVDELVVGDRVVTEAHRGCMRCVNCLAGAYTDCLNYGNVRKGHRTLGMTVNGGFAEYVASHVSTLYRLPNHVGFDDAVVLTTVGTVMHAYDALAGLVVGATIAVIGPGPIGLLAVQVGRELGASHVALLGTRESRLELGRRMGADTVADRRDGAVLERLREEVGGHGFDVVLECSGATTAVDDAIRLAKRSGNVVLVGFFAAPVTADLNHAVMNGITLHTVRGEGTGSVARAVALADRGRLDTTGLVTHHFPLEDIAEAYDTYAERRGDAIKVMVDIGAA